MDELKICFLFLNKHYFPQYPTGRHEWRIAHDPCSLGEDRVLNLTLTACPEGHFTCDGGKCIDVDQVWGNNNQYTAIIIKSKYFFQRCDRIEQCDDGSDEADCSIISLHGISKRRNPTSSKNYFCHISEGYRKAAPPPPPSSNSSSSLPVLVRTKISSFADVDVARMKLAVDFTLTLTWFDAR